MKKTEYDKYRLDVLETMIEQRDIKCRKTKNEMIKHLILDDEGKYIRDTLYDKLDKETYMIGVDPNNTEHLKKITKMVEKNEVKYMGLYQLNRIYFTSKQKIEL